MANAAPDAISNGRIASILPVSSTANTTPVSGERIKPPRTPASPTSGQKPGATCGKTCASRLPSAPPTMNIGASTPPEVPEPSDSDQISVLTTRMPTTRCRARRLPRSSPPMTSYPTPSACGTNRPPRPMMTPPIAGHHIQWIGSL